MTRSIRTRARLLLFTSATVLAVVDEADMTLTYCRFKVAEEMAGGVG